MAGVKEAIKAMADAAVAVAEAQEVLGALYEVRDRLDAQKARVDHLYASTVKSEDGRELSEISLTASPRLCWCARG